MARTGTKLRKVEALIARPGTSGERQAAEAARERILGRKRPRVKLTEAIVRDLPTPTTGSRLHFDSDVTGFAVRVFAPSKQHPKGAKTFLLSYWVNGAESRFRIGPWPTWSALAAREEARAIRQRIDRGQDPAGDRRERREAATMADLRDRYVADHLPGKAKQGQHDDKVMIERHILPALGAATKVADVDFTDIESMHRAITASGHPILANRVVTCCSKMFALSLFRRQGEDRPWRDAAQGNPCRGTKRNPEWGKERYLSTDEIAAAVAALDDYGDTSAADCIRLILHTGCRPGEAMNATWAQFNAEPGFWIKPAATTKQRRDHKLPLSAGALQFIAAVRKRRGKVQPGEFVFPGQRKGQRLKQVRVCWDWVCKRAGLHKVRLYDMRHTFASVGAGEGLSLPVIGRLLGHSQPVTTQRYAHIADAVAKAAADKIGGVIAAARKDADGPGH